MHITPDYPLLSHNTFGLDLRCGYFIELDQPSDVALLSRDEYFRTLPFLIIGAGSKLLFAGDYKGAVLRYTASSVRVVSESPDHVVLSVDAGKKWEQLVQECCADGLWGLENLTLIPGDVGGSTVQNVGAYGAEIADVLVAVHYSDLRDGSQHRLGAEECRMGYRTSVFKSPGMETALITSVELRLWRRPHPRLEYKGLQELSKREQLTPSEVMEHVTAIRRSKLPYPTEVPSAGSFFLNPIVTTAQLLTLQQQYPDLPYYPVTDSGGQSAAKVPAAWLIEQCGLKGVVRGQAGTYPRQPLVLVNLGGASATELIALADEIVASVADRFGIRLVPEVHIIHNRDQKSITDYSS